MRRGELRAENLDSTEEVVTSLCQMTWQKCCFVKMSQRWVDWGQGGPGGLWRESRHKSQVMVSWDEGGVGKTEAGGYFKTDKL